MFFAQYIEAIRYNQDLNPDLQFAIHCYVGEDGDPDFVKSLNYFHKAAGSGNREAKYALSLMYAEGIGTQADGVISAKWLRKAEKTNLPEAQYDLGYCYYVGDKEATILLEVEDKKRSEINTDNITMFLNEIIEYYQYDKQLPDELNVEKIPKILTNKRETFFPYRVNPRTMVGMNVKQNEPLAKKYYELAAAQDYPWAIESLGEMYTSGNSREMDVEKALEYFNRLKNKIKYRTNFFLGVLYKRGIKIPKDEKKAIELLLPEATEGHPAYADILGEIYELSDDPEIKNKEKAFMYYKLAAASHDKESLYRVGLIYCEGKLVPQDIPLGLLYNTLVALLNNTDAQIRMGEIRENGDGLPESEKGAYRWYEAALENGNILAYFKRGCMHLNGDGKYKNYKKGMEDIKKAAENGIPEAKLKLKELANKGKVKK
jgi:TPR repeat protein